MDIDLYSLSKKELEKLQADVKLALKTLDQRRKEEARKAAEEAVRQFGFSLDEVSGKRKSGKSASVPKYRNPENPSDTWSGRGRQPAWFKDALAKGVSPDDLAI
ncbi:MAG: H-NS histone family protein [Rhodobacteraceae bacterium]|nr:H-NS histone family protein [Paracoccaceae bacterium]